LSIEQNYKNEGLYSTLKKKVYDFWGSIPKKFETFSKKIDYRNGVRVFFFIRTATAQKILRPRREGSLVY